MIEQTTKEHIAAHLMRYVNNEKSANHAAKVLGISGAYISHIKNGKLEVISDDMWRKVSNLIGFKLAETKAHADTTQYLAFSNIYDLSRSKSTAHSIICAPGSGKTYSLDRVRRMVSNFYYVKCRRTTTEPELYKELLRTMGKNVSSKNIGVLLNAIADVVGRNDSPIIVIDEPERIEKPGPLLSMTDLHNAVNGRTGIILLGTLALKDKIDRGLMSGRPGYNTLASRFRFAEIPPPSKKDGALVAKAYGFNGDIIDNMLADARSSDHQGIDLRQLDVVIEKHR